MTSLTKRQRRMACIAVAGGESARSVAKRLGVSHSSINRALRDAGTVGPLPRSSAADESMAPDGEGGTGQFDDVDVHLVLGAASVESDRVMDRLAHYMQCERVELDDVVAEGDVDD